jgi:hypothetical protein
MFRVCESSSPSFNKLHYRQFSCPSTQILSFSSDESAPLSATATLRSSESSRLSVESWFLSGPKGLSSTYYSDCSWSNPLESLVTSLPLFRPIGSVMLNQKGLRIGSSTHPCSVQWSGLLRIPFSSQNSSVFFELGSSPGSCLTLFINDDLCCGTCEHLMVSYNSGYRHRRSHTHCKCNIEFQGSSSAKSLPVSLYGNSDGEDPNWHLKWLSNVAHPDGFEPIRDDHVLPTSTGETSISVHHGTRLIHKMNFFDFFNRNTYI